LPARSPAPKTSRQQLVAALKPHLPPKWKLVEYSRNLDVLDRPTVMVHASKIERAPQAPLSAYLTTCTVSVFDPQDDPARAQGSLDDEVLELIAALDQIGFINWTEAEATQLRQDGPLGWDITLEVLTKKE
jgi:hypothetical protein